MPTEFQGQVAFINGGGTGIGAAVARQFAAARGKVILMGRRREPLLEVAEPIGGLVVAGDAADAADVKVAIAQARDRFGGIDVLVANAGGHGVSELTQTDDESWRMATRLNLDTAFVCARELMPELVSRRGNIVVLSSLAGHFAGLGVVGCATMKHALIGLTRSLARDYGRQGVRTNADCPGWVRTAMADEQMQVWSKNTSSPTPMRPMRWSPATCRSAAPPNPERCRTPCSIWRPSAPAWSTAPS